QSHIDVLETDRFNLNPTVTFTDNDATRLTLQGKFSRWEQQDYQGLPAVGTLTGDFRTRPELFIGPADIDKSNSEFYGIWGTLEHRLDSVWSVTAKGRYSHSKFDTLAQNVVGADGFGADQPFFAPSTWGLINSELAQEQEERSFQAYATAEFEVGPSRNTVLLGADYSELDDNGFMDFDFPPIATVDLTDPVFLLPYDFPGARLYNQLTKNITYGGYLQWQSTLYDRLHLLASVRRGIVNTRFFNTTPGFESNYESDVGRFLPNVGAVVDIVEGFSVYASYNEGMRGQGGVNFVSTPRPALSDQIEVGIKFDLGGKLSGQLSAFEIQRQNIAITDFTDPQFRSVAKGQQRSRGIETNMTWQATDGLNVLGSYAYTEAEFTDSLAGVPEGNELPGVPRHSGRFWVNYAFQDELLRGLSVGTGIYAQSGTYLSKQNLFKSDAYYTMDATVAYKANGYKLGLSIKNLTDEDYF
ncbi:MAG: TonB-dependent siderophore receptor, partial [Gammaproteobacteria bacterium]